jgi:MFS transporter, UMF1 family
VEYSVREQRGWYVYDWANSAFYTTVVAVLLGPYLTEIAKAAAGADGTVPFFGIRVAAQSVWPYSVSLSVLLQVFVLPIVGAYADYGHRKRELLGVLTLIGSVATIAMYVVQGAAFMTGVLLYLAANLAYGCCITVYNSFLPEIAPPEQRDSVSARGWAIGYFGGGLLLLINLWMYSNAERLGMTAGQAVRLGLVSAGVWWLVFAIIPMMTLRNRAPAKAAAPGESALAAAVKQLLHTLSQLRRYPQTLLFLSAYLIYNDAIQTVFAMASQFGAEELKMSTAALTQAILMVQFVAFGGAIAFNWVAGWLGSRRTIMVTLAIWMFAVVLIYFWVYSVTQFYIAAAIVATVMGGSQALSRSLFSFMIPKGQEAEYYSVYEISDKGTSWLGPLFFGAALSLTHNFRIAIVSLIVFFALGLALLAKVNVGQAAREAGNEPPAIL